MHATTTLATAFAFLVGCAGATQPPSRTRPVPPRATEAAPPLEGFVGELQPLNGSLVTGTTRAALDGAELVVVLEVEGLEPQQLHPQHLHGFFGEARAASCPTVDADLDGDQVLSAKEAEAAAGPALLPLEPFPLPAQEDPVRYEARLPVDPDELTPLSARVVMVHGLTLDGTYQRGLPAACAELRRAGDVAPSRTE